MFIHAEAFQTPAEARPRYLDVRVLLSDAGEKEAACYNILYEGSQPVVAIVMPEAPKVELSGHRGRPVRLPPGLWHSLIDRHLAGRALGLHERHQRRPPNRSTVSAL